MIFTNCLNCAKTFVCSEKATVEEISQEEYLQPIINSIVHTGIYRLYKQLKALSNFLVKINNLHLNTKPIQIQI